ncbi:MAG TPA: proline--tRNA ligase [Dehalococcoidia bacterium]|nr:proline--tRNA ligase [Dehalococcoidia bacterium]
MRASHLFGKTLRQPPADAETISHQYLVRGGFVQQVAAGVYTYLPLGYRTLRKIEQIIREEMDAADGQEMLMPALQPVELWQESGRAETMADILFRLEDRRGREMCLGPTHEEVLTTIVRNQVQSYRDLPLLLYQIQTKFRDEPRPRAGLIRVREFNMKDAYSFDVDAAGLDVNYQKMVRAYYNIFRRCGLDSVAVEADSGAIGGKDSHEFMVVAESGENTVVFCRQCNYAANAERAEFRKPRYDFGPERAIEDVATPGVKTIEALAEFLDIPTAQTLKAVFYDADGELVFAVIRGDLEVNDVKLKNTLGATDLKLASDELLQRRGIVTGSASPVGLDGIRVIADDSIALGSNYVAGGNKPDVHLRNVNFPRDFAAEAVADIALAQAGSICPRCGGELTLANGIEVGHVFKLGATYSTKLKALFLDPDGVQQPILMGCYGIGSGRVMAAAIEQNHDDKGIIWPVAIAPYQVHLVGLNLDNPDVEKVAGHLYTGLSASGIEVLFDDRSAPPGVKFNDADLIGIPLRVTVSPRTLKEESVELKPRNVKETRLVPIDDALALIVEQIHALQAGEHGPPVT